jgi:hypothetical protein
MSFSGKYARAYAVYVKNAVHFLVASISKINL